MQQNVSSFAFGIGNAWIIPQTAADNFETTDPTPLTLNAIQDFNVDVSSKGQALRDQHGFAIDKRTADYDIKGKFSIAMTDFNLIANAIFGAAAAIVADGNSVNEFESGTIPFSTHSVTVTGAADFAQDMGVVLASNPAQEFERIASGSPAAGQYKLDAITGQYDFAPADSGLGVLISYLTDNGTTLQISNFLQGQTPAVGLVAFNVVTGDGVNIPNVRFTSFKKAPKRDNYAMYELDFEGFTPYGAIAIEYL